MIKAWEEPKDPDELLDYDLDWSGRLDDGDSITDSEWTVPDGLTAGPTSMSQTATKIWLSGGTLGENYTLLNRITTAEGRILDQSAKLRVRLK